MIGWFRAAWAIRTFVWRKLRCCTAVPSEISVRRITERYVRTARPRDPYALSGGRLVLPPQRLRQPQPEPDVIRSANRRLERRDLASQWPVPFRTPGDPGTERYGTGDDDGGRRRPGSRCRGAHRYTSRTDVDEHKSDPQSGPLLHSALIRLAPRF